MPMLYDLEQAMYACAPRAGAMSWDNVGLLVGNPTQEARKVLVALDGTHAVVDEAIALGCDTIVTHHPIMNCKWLPVQTLREDTPQGRLLRKLIVHNIGVICMHTNLDVAQGGVNDVLAQTLGLENVSPLAEDGIGRVGELKNALSVTEFATMVKTKLNANGVRYVAGEKSIKKVGVGGGACQDYVNIAQELGCDAFITGDVGYHSFQQARDLGLCLVDAGHFPTENPICQSLVTTLKSNFPELTVVNSTTHKEIVQYII